MRIFLDTPIILDVLLKKNNHYKDSEAILNLCKNEVHEGYISLIGLSDIYNLGCKLVGPRKAKQVIDELTSYVKIIGGNTQTVKKALGLELQDFEQALQYAFDFEDEGVGAIVTRNIKQASLSGMPVFTPTEFLRLGIEDFVDDSKSIDLSVL